MLHFKPRSSMPPIRWSSLVRKPSCGILSLSLWSWLVLLWTMPRSAGQESSGHRHILVLIGLSMLPEVQVENGCWSFRLIMENGSQMWTSIQCMLIAGGFPGGMVCVFTSLITGWNGMWNWLTLLRHCGAWLVCGNDSDRGWGYLSCLSRRWGAPG